MDKGRIEDLKELNKDLSETTNAEQIRLINEAGSKIRKEQQDARLKTARHEMISERLQGRQENVKDIQDRLINRTVIQGFGVNIPSDRWDEIFGN